MGDLLTARMTDGEGRQVAPRQIRVWTRNDSARLVELMASRILERTAAGEGAEGPFVPYDPDTTERTGQAGRVTLRRTGRLLGTLERIATSDKALVRATAPYARFVVQGTRNAPARDFLAVDDALEEQLVTETKARLAANAGGRAGQAGALAGGAAEVGPAPEVGAIL